MSFSAGTEAIVLLNGTNLSTYLRTAGASGSRDMLDTTTLGLHDRAFTPGLRNAVFNAEGFYDGSDDAIDAILADTLDGTACILTYLPYGDAFGNQGKGIDGDTSGYDIATPVDGIAGITLNIQSSVGNEPVKVLATLAERSIAGNGTALDNTAGTTEGAAGYLQVTAVDETLDVTIEHSDNGADWTTLITFDQSTAPEGQRVFVAGEVKRYVRATWDPDAYPATFHVAIFRA